MSHTRHANVAYALGALVALAYDDQPDITKVRDAVAVMRLAVHDDIGHSVYFGSCDWSDLVALAQQGSAS